MTNLSVMKTRTVWFSMLAILLAGTFLKAEAAGTLNKEDLKSLIASAKSAEDHERLAQHYDAKAAELDEESKEHQELAVQYRAAPTMQESKHPMSPQTAAHCKYFADDLHKAAERARQMAADHRQMAKQAK